MVIVEVPFVLDSTQFSHEAHKRSEGYHVSAIITSIERDTLKIFKGDDTNPQALEAYRTAGFLFERALYDVILQDEVIHRIGEVEQDGIILTPDAINMSRSRGIESKVTWRSMEKGGGVEDETGEFAGWWIQMKAYAKALNMNLWDLYAFFMNGNYRDRRQPVPRHWEIEFTQAEVDQNWKRIKNHELWMRQSGLFDSNGRRMPTN